MQHLRCRTLGRRNKDSNPTCSVELHVTCMSINNEQFFLGISKKRITGHGTYAFKIKHFIQASSIRGFTSRVFHTLRW